MKYKIVINKKKIIISTICIIGIWTLITLAIYASQYIPLKTIHYLQYKKNAKKTQLAYQYIDLLINENNDKKKYPSLIHLLNSHIYSFPKDPNNTYYLNFIGKLLLQLEADKHAVFYFTQSITLLPYNQAPKITFETLSLLSKIEYNIDKKIEYNLMLLKKYPKQANHSDVFYTLGNLYDSKAEWNLAYEAYDNLLSSSHTSRSPAIQQKIESIFFRVKRHKTRPSKVWNTVQEAKQAVHRGLYTHNGPYIKSLQSRNFFTVQWYESITDTNAYIPTFDLVPVLLHSKLSFESNFSPHSTSTQVLWKTYGWGRVGTWQMVFRQIQQPDTPSLNGKWEWAGIYFGEGNKLYVPE